MAALFSDAVALFSRRYAAVHALCSDADLPQRFSVAPGDGC